MLVYMTVLKGNDEYVNVSGDIRTLGIFSSLEDAKNSVNPYAVELNVWEDCDEWDLDYDVPIWNITSTEGAVFGWQLDDKANPLPAREFLGDTATVKDEPLIYACRMHGQKIPKLTIPWEEDPDPQFAEHYTDVHAVIYAFTLQ